MNMTLSKWMLLIFGALIVVAFIVVASRPVTLVPMDQTLVEENGMPVVTPHLPETLPILADTMPDFTDINQWLNTPNEQPLTKEALKGKVVMVDFWTYSCINCVRTQPVLKGWWKAYEHDGLVIIGVHTPEFAFEKEVSNVRDAVQRAGLTYPIALDSNYGTWNAYHNNYWPAAYFFDREGRLRFTHFGEGEYDKQEQVIRELLSEGQTLAAPPTGIDTTPNFQTINTPETYFGHLRFDHFENTDAFVRDAVANYTLISPRQNYWSLDGRWNIQGESAVNTSTDASFVMSVQANAMHLVLGTTDSSKEVRIHIDGRDPTDEELTTDTTRKDDGSVYITVDRKDLYRIARFPDAKRHTVSLTLQEPGIEFYAATFGE